LGNRVGFKSSYLPTVLFRNVKKRGLGMDATIVICIVVAIFAVLFAGIALDAHNRVEKLEEKVRELEARK
jgi:phosphomevalonate kinase